MPSPPKQVIDELIALGEEGVVRIPPALQDPGYVDKALLCGWDPWGNVAAALSEARLCNLIRGFVLFSQARRLPIGGSVSPVIELYRGYRERFPKLEPELTKWIVANRNNPYEPFGVAVDWGAQTYAGFLKAQRLRVVEIKEREEADQVAKRLRQAKRATELLANAVKRGDLKAVKVLLNKGAEPRSALSGASLQALAKQNNRLAVLEYLQQAGIP